MTMPGRTSRPSGKPWKRLTLPPGPEGHHAGNEIRQLMAVARLALRNPELSEADGSAGAPKNMGFR